MTASMLSGVTGDASSVAAAGTPGSTSSSAYRPPPEQVTSHTIGVVDMVCRTCEVGWIGSGRCFSCGREGVVTKGFTGKPAPRRLFDEIARPFPLAVAS